jgi:hypothetical protein
MAWLLKCFNDSGGMLSPQITQGRSRVTIDSTAYWLAKIPTTTLTGPKRGASFRKAAHSPMVVTEVIRTPIWGNPDPEFMTTAHVERLNLTMRMSMRRFSRLTNGFSQKALNLYRALALYFMHYNFCRRHSSIKKTPAQAAKLTDRLWTLHDLAKLPDLMTDGLAAA